MAKQTINIDLDGEDGGIGAALEIFKALHKSGSGVEGIAKVLGIGAALASQAVAGSAASGAGTSGDAASSTTSTESKTTVDIGEDETKKAVLSTQHQDDQVTRKNLQHLFETTVSSTLAANQSVSEQRARNDASRDNMANNLAVLTGYSQNGFSYDLSADTSHNAQRDFERTATAAGALVTQMILAGFSATSTQAVVEAVKAGAAAAQGE